MIITFIDSCIWNSLTFFYCWPNFYFSIAGPNESYRREVFTFPSVRKISHLIAAINQIRTDQTKSASKTIFPARIKKKKKKKSNERIHIIRSSLQFVGYRTEFVEKSCTLHSEYRDNRTKTTCYKLHWFKFEFKKEKINTFIHDKTIIAQANKTVKNSEKSPSLTCWKEEQWCMFYCFPYVKF